jgi:hypothetical protein
LTGGDPAGLFSDFANGMDGGRLSLKRLAYAARTTSSFPGAFEPATPYVDRTIADVDASEVDLWGICSETGAPERPVRKFMSVSQ